MVRNIAMLFLLFLVSTVTHAQLESQFVFSGQNAESLKLEKTVNVVKPVKVEVPSTCSRQIPIGEQEVCENVTRYRQECSWIPSSQMCRTEYERICRPVTRTRQECSGSESRTICTDNPGRRVCTQRPTRQVCRTRPDGRQHCTNVGGGTHCTTVGGGRSCRQVPGNRICRTVTYTDSACDSVPRQRCSTIPGRNECRDVAYSVRECRNEMQYRTESYACTRTETVNQNIAKKVSSEIEVQILTNGIVEEFPMAVALKEMSPSYDGFAIEAKLLKEPNAFVILKRKNVSIVSNSETEVVLKGSVVLEILAPEMLPISFPSSVASASIEKETSKLVIVLDGGVAAQGSVELKITHKAFLSSTKTLVELKDEYPSEKIQLGMVEEKAALSIDIKDAIKRDLQKKDMRMELKLNAHMNLQGEIMNAVKPDTMKLYKKISVKLK